MNDIHNSQEKSVACIPVEEGSVPHDFDSCYEDWPKDIAIKRKGCMLLIDERKDDGKFMEKK